MPTNGHLLHFNIMSEKATGHFKRSKRRNDNEIDKKIRLKKHKSKNLKN